MSAITDGSRWVFAVPPILVVLGLLRGVRAEYLGAALLIAVLAAVGPRSRRFAALALPFAAVGVIYDHFDLVSGLRAGIHVGDLFRAELMLFGVPLEGVRVVPSTWLAAHTHWLLDLACGFSYLAYLYEVFIVGAWLYLRRDEPRMSTLAWGFLLVNLIGMFVWLIFPAAPPWYVTQYGAGPAQLDALPSAAGATRFDELLGIHYFAEFYARSRNVFGAMPSLHVAYPTLVFLVLRERNRLGAALALSFALLVAFSAIYLEHHYVLDAFGGALAALLAYGIARYAVYRRHGASPALSPIASPPEGAA
jgi:membrane-associated phospholipid phosphatase